MKIWYSHHIFSTQTYGGVSRYFSELVRYYTQHQINCQIVSPLYVNEYISEISSSGLIGCKIRKWPKTGRIVSKTNDLLSSLLIPNKPDIYHETYFSGFEGARPQNIKVTTVYDLIHELYPQYFDPRDQVYRKRKLTLERADHIICISENTKKDLLKLYSISEDKVSVIPLAVRPVGLELSPAPNLKDRFFLFVGTRGQYKNSKVLFEAFANSKAKALGTKLICFGGGAFSNTELKIFEQLGIANHVQQKSGTDHELYQLYQSALAFIFPSEYEGFGLPILEAMAASCPVICSRSSSFPEVAKEAALYFDFNDHKTLTAQLDLLNENSAKRDELILLGKQNVTNFSWKKCALDTLKVYQRLCPSASNIN